MQRRLPPQGGLPPVAVPDGPVVEIACDESGFSGSNLLDPATPRFTHASVCLSGEEAGALVDELRPRVRWARHEVKSGHVLRGTGPEGLRGAALARLIAPLQGRAFVHVVDKELFLAGRVVDLFSAPVTYAAGTRLAARDRSEPVALLRAGRAHPGPWHDLLAAFCALVRTKRRRDPDVRLTSAFLGARDALLLAIAGGAAPATRPGPGTAAGTAVAALTAIRRDGVDALVRRLHDGDRSVPPPLEPLLPALADTVLAWSAGGRRVLVVHDEQSALTADRLRRLQDALTTAAPGAASPLAGLVTVDSRDDPRVQVADLLAGLARRSSALRFDPLLQPFLTPETLAGTPVPRSGATTRSGPAVTGGR